MTYLNIKSTFGVETIDQIDKKDYTTIKEYKKTIRDLIKDYHISGHNVYTSLRCTKYWKNK